MRIFSGKLGIFFAVGGIPEMPEGSFVSAERQGKRRKVMKSGRKKKVLMRQVVAEFGAARGSSSPSETSSHLKTRTKKSFGNNFEEFQASVDNAGMTSRRWIEPRRLKTLTNYEWERVVDDVLRSSSVLKPSSRARSWFFTAFSYSFLKKVGERAAEQLLNCCLKFQLCFSALEWSTSWLEKSLFKNTPT